MKPTFRGFQEKGNTCPTASISTNTIESPSEISDYDSTIESRDTTPTQEDEQQVSTVKKKKPNNGFSIKRLIDHFSASDSDITEGQTKVTRRRKSKILQMGKRN